MATHLRTEFVVDALQMAIASRKPTPPGLVHHSDRGVQYTSLSFGERLEDEELIPSMGPVSSLRQHPGRVVRRYANNGVALPGVVAYPAGGEDADLRVHRGFYYTRRRRSSLGHLSPAGFEEVKLTEAAALREYVYRTGQVQPLSPI